jgi:prolyl-tRNA synthetase
MHLSHSLSQTNKNAPKDASSINHSLLVQAGFIKQETAGVYSLLPFGLRVLRRIETIIRQEMDDLGAQEIFMPSLQSATNWRITQRWDSVDILFKVASRWGDREYALGPTHEEIVTPLVQEHVHSYRDLPMAVYQIQTKFRDEKRAKSGIVRGREFGMKDMYSFHAEETERSSFYERVTQAYLSIFAQCGIDAKVTEASGGDFTKKHSHEFMAISDAGEDTIVYCPHCTFAQNVEIASVAAGDSCPRCQNSLLAAKAIEIGNTFDLGTKFTEAFKFTFVDRSGQTQPVLMGCYGIGTTRLLGTIVETHHDDQGIIWPETVAPYDVHIVGLDIDQIEVRSAADQLIAQLQEHGQSVLFDDRTNVRAGAKFADADLIGIPTRIVISQKTVVLGKYELKRRDTNLAQMIVL